MNIAPQATIEVTIRSAKRSATIWLRSMHTGSRSHAINLASDAPDIDPVSGGIHGVSPVGVFGSSEPSPLVDDPLGHRHGDDSENDAGEDVAHPVNAEGHRREHDGNRKH